MSESGGLEGCVAHIIIIILLVSLVVLGSLATTMVWAPFIEKPPLSSVPKSQAQRPDPGAPKVGRSQGGS
eukprot:5092322-Pyramimonas_sp.AAC.1